MGGGEKRFTWVGYFVTMHCCNKMMVVKNNSVLLLVLYSKCYWCVGEIGGMFLDYVKK